MLINIGLLDSIYVFEALQILPILVIAAWSAYLIIRKEKLTQKVKLGLWVLLAINVVCGSVVWSLSLYNYMHYEKPIYKAENQRYSAQH